jgi:hypothetical protein
LTVDPPEAIFVSEIQYFRNLRSVNYASYHRAKYRLDEGDSLTVLDLEGSILLSPKVPVVPKLAAEIERLRLAAGLEVEDLLTSSSTRRTKQGRTRKSR